MKKPPLILVADDEQPMLRLLRACFRLEGYQVVTASDGPAALDTFERCQPDLVLLDVGMPVLDGFEVLEVIRRRSDVPAILFTARDEPSYPRRAREAGADFLAKPFDRTDLMARVRAALRRRRTRAAGSTGAAKKG